MNNQKAFENCLADFVRELQGRNSRIHTITIYTTDITKQNFIDFLSFFSQKRSCVFIKISNNAIQFNYNDNTMSAWIKTIVNGCCRTVTENDSNEDQIFIIDNPFRMLHWSNHSDSNAIAPNNSIESKDCCCVTLNISSRTKMDYRSGVSNETNTGTTLSNTNNELIGARFDKTTFSAFFNEKIDVVEFSSRAMSSIWIRKEYNNQNASSSFYTLGTVETELYADYRSIDAAWEDFLCCRCLATVYIC